MIKPFSDNIRPEDLKNYNEYGLKDVFIGQRSILLLTFCRMANPQKYLKSLKYSVVEFIVYKYFYHKYLTTYIHILESRFTRPI